MFSKTARLAMAIAFAVVGSLAVQTGAQAKVSTGLETANVQSGVWVTATPSGWSHTVCGITSHFYGRCDTERFRRANGFGTSWNPNLIYAGHSYLVPGASGPVAAPIPAPQTPTHSVPASSATKRDKVLAFAQAQIGKWYRWGYAGPTYFDCSGLTMRAYERAGVRLPHHANDQKRYGHAVSRANARPGDLILFMYSNGHVYHAAIYAGGNYMIAAPHTGAKVQRQKIYSAHIMFRRIV